MIKLLLLTCGTNACYHIVKTLKTKFPNDFFIVGTDINKQWEIPTCQYLDSFYQSPYSNDRGYYDFILNICKNENINYLLPSFDYDQLLFFPENKDLIELNVKSFGTSEKSLSFYKNKDLTNNYLNKIGILTPKIYSRANLLDDEEYFIKPKNGVGSIGVRKSFGRDINNINDIDNYLIQEVCSEPEYTLECFCFNKNIYSVCRIRMATKSGVCVKAKIYFNTELNAIAQKFANCTDVPYIFNMQFMKNKKNEYVCTDLNLRTAGGMSLSSAAGWDEVSSLANIMLKNNEEEIIKTVNFKIDEQYVMRAYTDLITKKVKSKIAFDFDGTLLDSRKRHSLVMDEVLNEYSLHIDTTDLVEYKANKKNNLDWLKEKNIDEKLAFEINKKWISLIEDEKYLKCDILYENVYDYLKEMSKENDLFLITSRKNKENLISQVKKLGIYQFFEKIIVVNGDDGASLKADALIENNIDFIIGDTEIDYNASKIANCGFKAVLNGFRNKSFWDDKRVDYFHF